MHALSLYFGSPSKKFLATPLDSERLCSSLNGLLYLYTIMHFKGHKDRKGKIHTIGESQSEPHTNHSYEETAVPIYVCELACSDTSSMCPSCTCVSSGSSCACISSVCILICTSRHCGTDKICDKYKKQLKLVGMAVHKSRQTRIVGIMIICNLYPMKGYRLHTYYTGQRGQFGM